jgi:hypothetical protein
MNQIRLKLTVFVALGLMLIAIARRSFFFWGVFVGFSAVYTLKYGVFGLRQWDTWFHPERLTADTTGPYKAFSDPLLRGLWA